MSGPHQAFPALTAMSFLLLLSNVQAFLKRATSSRCCRLKPQEMCLLPVWQRSNGHGEGHHPPLPAPHFHISRLHSTHSPGFTVSTSTV